MGPARPRPSVPSGLSAPLPGLYNYYDDEQEKLQIVEMPLAHKLSSLIILMPHHVEPLERLEKLLTKEQLKVWLGKMQKKAVAISLPKGVVEVTHDLQVRGGPPGGRGAWRRGLLGHPFLSSAGLPRASGGVQAVLESCVLLGRRRGTWPGERGDDSSSQIQLGACCMLDTLLSSSCIRNF